MKVMLPPTCAKKAHPGGPSPRSTTPVNGEPIVGVECHRPDRHGHGAMAEEVAFGVEAGEAAAAGASEEAKESS